MKKLSCEPIGVIHTAKLVKFDTPHQPTDGRSERNIIELFPGHRYEDGLRDLEGFERVWLVWWFDRNTTWRPMVLPPRGSAKRRGVFATRSPHRPAPIGITAVPLLEVSGRTVVVGNCDLLDQTPILDIKPYISSVDSFPEQKSGWLAEVEAECAKPPRYRVTLLEKARQQAEWLRAEWAIDFMSKVSEILERDPSPHRIRRITKAKDGIFRLSSGGWRVYFSVTGMEVVVHSIAPGYPHRLLVAEGFEIVPDYQAQLAFEQRWAS